jgi:hypothetical protein
MGGSSYFISNSPHSLKSPPLFGMNHEIKVLIRSVKLKNVTGGCVVQRVALSELLLLYGFVVFVCSKSNCEAVESKAAGLKYVNV